MVMPFVVSVSVTFVYVTDAIDGWSTGPGRAGRCDEQVVGHHLRGDHAAPTCASPPTGPGGTNTASTVHMSGRGPSW